jgi:hypothetical protein
MTHTRSGQIAGVLLAAVPAAFLATPGWSAEARDSPMRDGQQAATLDQVGAWLPRLVGKFRLEGSVEEAGEAGALRRESIRGQADCRHVPGATAVSGRAPAVECFLDMLWTPSPAADGAAAQNSTPAPHTAMLVYGYELPVIGLRHMLVDGEGVAEGGAGQLFDNTLVSTSGCARIQGNCQRSVRITAAPDLRSVRMNIDMAVDGKRAGSQELTLHREGSSP